MTVCERDRGGGSSSEESTCPFIDIFTDESSVSSDRLTEHKKVLGGHVHPPPSPTHTKKCFTEKTSTFLQQPTPQRRSASALWER